MIIFSHLKVYPTHLGQYTNNPNAYIMFYELEKPYIASENSSSSSIKSSSSTSTISSLSNGYMNGTMQRSNGFFTKRETSFSTSSIHSKYVSFLTTNDSNLKGFFCIGQKIKFFCYLNVNKSTNVS